MTVLRSLLRRREPPELPIPPPDLIERVGAGDFVAVGNEFLRLFISPGGLRPSDRVLDVGCGAGRMAAPLMRYLRSGSYEGFDVSHAAISWCKANLEPLNPRFLFQHVDVSNDVFNPSGSIDPLTFRFPYGDRAFDFVFLASVFTHMFADETTRYLHEISRVLRPGGRMLATFFLLDEVALQGVQRGELPFTHECDHGAFAFQSSRARQSPTTQHGCAANSRTPVSSSKNPSTTALGARDRTLSATKTSSSP